MKRNYNWFLEQNCNCMKNVDVACDGISISSLSFYVWNISYGCTNEAITMNSYKRLMWNGEDFFLFLFCISLFSSSSSSSASLFFSRDISQMEKVNESLLLDLLKINQFFVEFVEIWSCMCVCWFLEIEEFLLSKIEFIYLLNYSRLIKNDHEIYCHYFLGVKGQYL
jgi:hypothetical protein